MIYFVYFSFSLTSYSPRLLGKKKKFISFRERFPNKDTQFQTKMFQIYTRFQTKTAQKPYPLGRHIPQSVYVSRALCIILLWSQGSY